MTISLNGSGGITYPDGSVNTTRSVSTAGDTMTGTLTAPAVSANSVEVKNGDIVLNRTDGFDMSFVLATGPNSLNKNVVFQKAGGGVINGSWQFRGKVSTPEVPCWAAGGNLNGLVTSGTTVPFGLLAGNSLNNGSGYNTSTYAFTAPIGGYYHVSFTIYCFGNQHSSLLLAKNGAAISYGSDVTLAFKNTAVGDVSVGYSTVIYLAVNDNIKVMSRGQGVPDSYVYLPHSLFSGYFIG